MIPVPGGVRVWIATGHCDMRRGMRGLALQVQQSLKHDPHAGDLWVFRGRKGDLVKMWVLADFKNVQTDAFAFAPYLSLKGQSEFDCIEERARSLAQTMFSGNMGKGGVIFTDATEQTWRPAAPESIGRMLWKVACGKK